RRQQVAVIVLGDRLVDKADAALIEHLAVFILGIDDHKALLVVAEMALDQGKCAFADRTEADHYDGPVDTGMHWPFRHRQLSPGREGLSLVGRKRDYGRNYAAEAARSDFGICLLGARSRPRAPLREPGSSSRASNRSRSKGPGIRRAEVFSV